MSAEGYHRAPRALVDREAIPDIIFSAMPKLPEAVPAIEVQVQPGQKKPPASNVRNKATVPPLYLPAGNVCVPVVVGTLTGWYDVMRHKVHTAEIPEGMTPTGFEVAGGKEGNRNWRVSMRALLDDGYQGQTAKNWLDAHDLEQYVPKEKRKLTSADDSPSPDPRRNPVTVPKRTGDRILPGQVVLSPLAGSPPATTLGPAPVPVPTPAQQRAYMLDDDPPDALPLLPLSQTAEPLGDSNGLDAMLQELFPNGRRDQGRNARASGPRARRPPHSYASMLRDLGFPTENEWEMEDPIVS